MPSGAWGALVLAALGDAAPLRPDEEGDDAPEQLQLQFYGGLVLPPAPAEPAPALAELGDA
eukprot:14066290-Alexandrium_andersonii.AAC.1